MENSFPSILLKSQVYDLSLAQHMRLNALNYKLSLFKDFLETNLNAMKLQQLKSPLLKCHQSQIGDQYLLLR